MQLLLQDRQRDVQAYCTKIFDVKSITSAYRKPLTCLKYTGSARLTAAACIHQDHKTKTVNVSPYITMFGRDMLGTCR